MACTHAHDVDAGVAQAVTKDLDAATPVPAATSGALCTRVAAIQCEGEQRCCSRRTRSLERCQSDVASSCAQSLYLDSIASSPASGFDARTADQIINDLAQRTLQCDPLLLRLASSEQGLRGLFRGTLGAEASCSPVGGVTGNPATVATALASCRLDEGLACLPSGLLGEWSCAPKQPLGQPCLTDDNCQPDSACDNYSEPSLGTCVERLPLGAACENAGACASLFCDDGQCGEPDADAVYCPAV